MQIAIPSNSPAMFASLDALLAASTAHCSETALLNTARMVTSLKADVLNNDARLASLSAARCCAVLLLYNSSLARLALTLHCPQLLQLAVAVPLAASPQLRSEALPTATVKSGAASVCMFRAVCEPQRLCICFPFWLQKLTPHTCVHCSLWF